MTEQFGDKKYFKKTFSSGNLYNLWKDVYESDTYLSKWAYHRMGTVLKCIDRLRIPEKSPAVDIGIGSGILLSELARRNLEVVGVDFSLNIALNCRERLRNNSNMTMPFIVGDIETLPIKKNMFQMCTSIGVFEYLDDIYEAFCELHRLTRPGGYVIVAVASYHRIGSLLKLAYLKLAKRKTKGKDTIGRPGVPSPKLVKPLEFRELALRAGFKIDKFTCFGARIFGRYVPFRFCIPGFLYLGDHCLIVLRKPY